MPSWALIAVLAAGWLGVNLLFGWLYFLDLPGIANARPGSFADAFFFSVQTLGTIGYGNLAPTSLYVHGVVTAEAFAGLLGLAVAAGLIFARFSRPTARVLFSRCAVVTTFEGVPTLMFRAANERANQILEAEVTINLTQERVSREGELMRRFEELRLTRSRSPLFALSWTVMHPIDEASPFRHVTPDSLAESRAEIMVVLGGVDESLSQRIYARHIYRADDIVWNARFVDILEFAETGERILDFSRFHDVEPAAEAVDLRAPPRRAGRTAGL
jgi:inward rectifier potassium channel